MSNEALIEAILTEVVQANDQRDLPDYLVERVQSTLARIDPATVKQQVLLQLRHCINDYHPYAQMGYLGGGYTAGNIEEQLKQLLA